MRVRLLTLDDLPACMALKQSAGWNQTERDWRLLLEQRPDGCFAIESQGCVVASATAYWYGAELAWIGMVLALPEVRGRGFGGRAFRAALDACHQRGIRCLKLDATDMGRPLYERAGFLPEYEVQRWGGKAGVTDPSNFQSRPAGSDVRPLRTGELKAAATGLAAFDACAFGADRSLLLEALMGNSDWAVCLEGDGELVGYAMSRPGANARYFGPCVASNAAAARALLEAFLLRYPGQAVFVDAPAPNREARALLESYGFAVRRTLLRMYCGPNDRPGVPARIFGLAGFEYG
jgi:GNAT superfamily N-acetyltransferase